MRTPRLRGLMRSLLVPVAATAMVLLTGSPGAHAATDLSTVAEALREDPVYVDPAASDQLSSADAEALSDKIRDAGKPVFVAVLPADQPERDIFLNLRTETGITGLYAIRSGDRFGARADTAVLPPRGVQNLVTAVRDVDDPKAQLNDFVDAGVGRARGPAPAPRGGGGGAGPPRVLAGGVAGGGDPFDAVDAAFLD
ncbi:hypothetical protein ACFXDP_28885, partial [Streptomyces sp. NPDC059374]